MLSVEEALQLVLQHAVRQSLLKRAPARVAALDAVGLVLAEEVVSDVDSPPHDKSMVDGYAVVAADLAHGQAQLEVVEEVTAGAVPTLPIRAGQATRIMTGAPIPDGAQGVVMVERSEFAPADTSRSSALQGSSASADAASANTASPNTANLNTAGVLGTVTIRDPSFKPQQNILPRATSIRRGDIILRRGQTIRPIEVGVLAEVGRDVVQVYRRPTVAVLATGNELVPAHETPGPGQIRNSNSPLLVAMARRCGADATDLGIARDDRESLLEHVRTGLESDVLILSGGVSAGVLDLVPGVFTELGIRQVFHKVHLKPGKPIWFGVKEDGGRRCLVFGLPGNPVGSLVCFELFVRRAIAALTGSDGAEASNHTADAAPREVMAQLSETFTHRGDRPTYHPGVLRQERGCWTVRPIRWLGSADLRAMSEADCLIHFPPGDATYAQGSTLPVHRLA